MSKYKITYSITGNTALVEAKYKDDAIQNFIKANPNCKIDKCQYVYEGQEKLKEFYCIWWNGNGWENRVVLAHNEQEIEDNIKATLDYAVYDFHCCENTSKAIDSVHRSIWD